MEEKISIVVPIYNVENYMNRCLNSIKNQTYTNLEILLINDGSLDNCQKICEKFEKEDNRFKLYNKENGGLSDARNYGLERISSKYVCFIDSDDYIEKNYIEILYNNLITYNADISVCGIANDVGGMKKESNQKQDLEELTSEQALKKMIDLHYDFKVVAWNKLYKKDLFEDVRYPKGKIYEDVATTYKLVSKAKKVVYAQNPLYVYCFNPTSITKTEKYNEREIARMNNADEMVDFVVKKYPDLKKDFISYKMCQYIAVQNVMFKSNIEDENMSNKIRKFVKENFNNIFQSNLTFEKKMQVFIFDKLLFKMKNRKKVNFEKNT